MKLKSLDKKKKYLAMTVLTALLSTSLVGCSDKEEETKNKEEVQEVKQVNKEKVKEKESVKNEVSETDNVSKSNNAEKEFDVDTDNHILAQQINDKISFTSGTYKLREIPKGYYLFIANDDEQRAELRKIGKNNQVESFTTHNSFDYIYIPNTNRIELKGTLIPIAELKNYNKTTGFALYKSLKGIDNYRKSGTYKVGSDIEPIMVYLEIDNPSRISSYDVYTYNDKNDNVLVSNGLIENEDIVEVKLEKGQYLNLTNSKYSVNKPLTKEEIAEAEEKEKAAEKELEKKKEDELDNEDNKDKEVTKEKEVKKE